MKRFRIPAIFLLFPAVLLLNSCGNNSTPAFNPVVPSGSFSNAGLKGGYVFTAAGTDPADGDYFAAGSLQADGAGNATGIEDVNLGSGVDSAVPVTGTYLVLALFLTSARLVPNLYAADHRESPRVDSLPEGDITDVYVFTDSVDSTRVVFVMNVNPFAVPGELPSYSFSPDYLYQFKIDNTGDAREDKVIQVVLSGTGQKQTVQVFGPAAPVTTGSRNQLLAAAATASGAFGTIIGYSTGVQAFTGKRNDPFVFDVSQFFRILNSSQDLFRQVGSSFRGRTVRADGTSGVDTFAGFRPHFDRSLGSESHGARGQF